MNLAALGGEHASHRVQVQRIGHQHIERLGGNRNNVAAPEVRRRALDRFRQRMVLIDLYEISRQGYSREPAGPGNSLDLRLAEDGFAITGKMTYIG